ncbi:GntR family transcriptional regulator [Streptomyces sp. NPDC001941]|uniref:GntR family transcriptional regulator n=1 Tax=Streptomyces sp. NPDC001941 TaxID=3154659 RepID=UPI003330EC90
MTPRIERTPPYMQVVEHFRKQILEGTLAPGERIPAVRQIAEDWDLAHATAAKVLSTLRGQGLVETLPGIGTIVQGRVHRGATDRAIRAITTGKIYPPGEHAVITGARFAPAPAEVAELLGIGEGDSAIRRERVTHNASGPISASVSWFDAALGDVVPELLEPARILGGTAQAITTATGRQVRTIEERTAADGATPEQAGVLGVEVGSPVFLGVNVYRDADGDPIEVGQSVAGPRRWVTHTTDVPSDDV